MAEPRRAALGLLAAAGAGALDHPGTAACRRAFAEGEWELLLQALATGCNTPLCSSTGRLFDAVASLLGLCQHSSFEGETGLRLEGLALQAEPLPPVPMPLLPAAGLELGWLDWAPLVRSLLDSGAAGVSPRQRAATFHASLAAGLAGAAAQAAARSGNGPVLLAGGCFQNRLLLESTSAALRAAGLEPYWAEQVPCNDGGLALGQLWAALANLPITKESVEASPCAWPPPA